MARRPALFIAAWALAAGLGALASVHLSALLSTSLAVPASSSQAANAVLTRDFGENVEGTYTVVLGTSGRISERAAVEAMRRGVTAAARAVPTAHASAPQEASGVVYANVGSRLGLDRAASYVPALRRALGRAGLGRAYVTGTPALQYDMSGYLATDLRVGEAVAVAAALLLLVAALGRSVAVAVPFAVALATTGVTLGIVYVLAHLWLMVLYIPNLVELIGLGLAVDYSLLIVHRYRQELAGKAVTDAVAATMATAGRTVVVSGLAVASGLAFLALVPVPFIQSLAVAGLLVPLVSVAAALTLQPALLAVLGRRALAGAGPGRLPPGTAPTGTGRPGGWERWATLVVRHPGRALAAGLVVAVALAAPATALRLTPASVTAIPASMPAARGLQLLRSRVGPGVATPMEVVVDSGGPGLALTPAMDAATNRLANELLARSDVFVVAIGDKGQYVAGHGRYRRTVVVARDDFGGAASQALARDTLSRLVPQARFPPGARVYVGGPPAQGEQFLAAVYGVFPRVVALVAAVAFVLLARATRSLLLPLMALALDAVSVACAYGAIVLVFRYGAGARLLHLYHVGQVEGWVPVFLFALLFGLSMDYEVFFVSAMREAWDAGATNRAAVVQGLARTGRVVTVAALVMVGALAGMFGGRVAGLQELGTGLALGVLLDATLVRGLLMPSLMSLAGRWNWWLPGAAARLLRVEASPRSVRRGEASTEAAGAGSTSRR